MIDTLTPQRIELRHLRLPRQGRWQPDAESWHLLMLRQGEGVLHNGSESHQLRTGEAGVLPKGAAALYGLNSRTESAISWLSLPIEGLERSLPFGARLALRHAVVVLRTICILPRDAELSVRLSQLAEQVPPSRLSPPDEIQLARWAEPVLGALQEFLLHFGRSTGGRAGRVVSILGSISESELQELSVDELARRCGCSRRHLSRLIRLYCGTPLVSLRMELRLDKAAGLLRTADSKVFDIAMDCGFNHLGSFTAKFRQRFGATPGDWRRRAAEEGNGWTFEQASTRTKAIKQEAFQLK